MTNETARSPDRPRRTGRDALAHLAREADRAGLRAWSAQVLLDEGEVARALDLAAARTAAPAVLRAGNRDRFIRDAGQVILSRDDRDAAWLFARLDGCAASHNAARHRVALDEPPRAPEAAIVTYRPGGFYRPHRDAALDPGEGRDKKLSASIFLDDPDAYGGGDLRIAGHAVPEGERARGTAVLFSALARHEVRPVTAGMRRTLVVSWWGPRWT